MNANDVATITIPVTAPAQPQTIVNTSSVDGLASDLDDSDNEVVRYNAVKDPALGGDTTAPSRTATQMFDLNADGFVDQVVVTFNENLATCPAPCTAGWTLTNVPSAGSLSLGHDLGQSGDPVDRQPAEPARHGRGPVPRPTGHAEPDPGCRGQPCRVLGGGAHRQGEPCGGRVPQGSQHQRGVQRCAVQRRARRAVRRIHVRVERGAAAVVDPVVGQPDDHRPCGHRQRPAHDLQLHAGVDGPQLERLRDPRHRNGLVALLAPAAAGRFGAGRGDGSDRRFVHRDGMRVAGFGGRRQRRSTSRRPRSRTWRGTRLRAPSRSSRRCSEPARHRLEAGAEQELVAAAFDHVFLGVREQVCPVPVGGDRHRPVIARRGRAAPGAVPSSVPTRWISSTNEGSDHSDHRVQARLRIDCLPKSITVAGG